jgi:hypothetical protein
VEQCPAPKVGVGSAPWSTKYLTGRRARLSRRRTRRYP